MSGIYGRVYAISNLLNGKQYVGQTTLSLEKRFAVHCEARDGRSYVQRSIAKYGAEQFTIKQLCSARSKRRLDAAERKWIKRLGSLVPHGYNLQAGGEGGKMHPESIAKSSEVMKRKYSTPEVRRYLSDRARKQFQNEDKRLTHSAGVRKAWSSPELRAKVAENSRRQHANAAMKARHSDAMKAAYSTPEARRRLSEIRRAAWARSRT